MKGDWPSIVLGGIAAGCGIYVRVRLWGDMPEELGFTIYAMIFIGLLIVLMNVREMIKKKEGDIMKKDNCHLPTKCPLCESKKGLQFSVENGVLRLICIDCEDVDETLDQDKIFDCFITIVQYSSDNEGLDHERMSDIIYNKFDLPELDEEEEKDDETE